MIHHLKDVKITIDDEAVQVESFGKNIVFDADIIRAAYRGAPRFSIVDSLCNKMHMKIESADAVNEYLKKYYRGNK